MPCVNKKRNQLLLSVTNLIWSLYLNGTNIILAERLYEIYADLYEGGVEDSETVAAMFCVLTMSSIPLLKDPFAQFFYWSGFESSTKNVGIIKPKRKTKHKHPPLKIFYYQRC